MIDKDVKAMVLMEKFKERKTKIVLSRLWDVLIYHLIVATLLYLFIKYASCHPITQLFCKNGLFAEYFFTIGVLLLFSLIYFCVSVGIRYNKNPFFALSAISISIFSFSSFALISLNFVPELPLRVIWLSLVPFFFLFLLACFIQKIVCLCSINLDAPKDSGKKVEVIKISRENYLEWVHNDDAEAKKDFVDNKKYANDIADIIYDSEHKKENPHGVGILLAGKFGVGKTTTVKWAEEILSKKQSLCKYVFCFVDGWNRKEEYITRQILHRVLDELKKSIDIIPIRGLPENYSEALGEANWFFRLLSKIESDYYDAQSKIKRLDELLYINNTRVVVVIEDIDRNIDENIKKNLWHIEGLLARLQKSRCISFIVSGAPKIISQSELQRVFDNLIAININPGSFLMPTQICRELKNEDFTNNDLPLFDPLSKEERSEIEIMIDEKKAYFSFTQTDFGLITMKPYAGILSRMSSIRLFRQALHEVELNWKNHLKGEVDFDDLIAMTILKHYDIDLFNKIISAAEERNNYINLKDDLHFRNRFRVKKTPDDYAKDSSEITSEAREKDKNMELLNEIWQQSFNEKVNRQPLCIRKYALLIAHPYKINENESDQYLLRESEKFFENENILADEFAKFIYEHERLMDIGLLLRKYFDNVKIHALIFALIKYKFNNSKETQYDWDNIALSELLKVKFYFEDITEDKKELLINLVDISINKFGALRKIFFKEPLDKNQANKVIPYYEIMIEEIQKKINEKDTLKQFIDGLTIIDVNNFLSNLPFDFSRKGEPFTEEVLTVEKGSSWVHFNRKEIAWLLDSLLAQAQEGNKKAIELLFGTIALQTKQWGDAVFSNFIIKEGGSSTIESYRVDTIQILVKKLFPSNAIELLKILKKFQIKDLLTSDLIDSWFIGAQHTVKIEERYANARKEIERIFVSLTSWVE